MSVGCVIRATVMVMIVEAIAMMGKPMYNGSGELNSDVSATAWPSDRAIPPNTPAAYPQPLSRHQYQRKTFGGRIPAASVPNIQRNAVLIEVPKYETTMPVIISKDEAR